MTLLTKIFSEFDSKSISTREGVSRRPMKEVNFLSDLINFMAKLHFVPPRVSPENVQKKSNPKSVHRRCACVCMCVQVCRRKEGRKAGVEKFCLQKICNYNDCESFRAFHRRARARRGRISSVGLKNRLCFASGFGELNFTWSRAFGSHNLTHNHSTRY